MTFRINYTITTIFVYGNSIARFILQEGQLRGKHSSSTFSYRNEKCRKVFTKFFCLEGRHLHKSRSRHPNKKKFKVLDHTVYISPGEIFETFVEFDDDLTMGNESYSKYLNFKVLYQYIFA